MNRGRHKFNKYKSLLKIFVRIIFILPYRVRLKLFNGFRMMQGTKGLAIRYVFLKSLVKECGDNVSIHPNVYLFNLKNLSLGQNVSIHPLCYIDATGGIEIGNDVSIAHGASIMSTTHLYEDKFMPIKDQDVASYFTKIEDNVWIGAKVTILAGTNVAYGSVIAANAVVTKNVPENWIVGGVPAKKLKDRF